MAETEESGEKAAVDKTLVAMFLKMTPEERVAANDNMVRTILELRHAFKKKKSEERRSGGDS